MRPLPPPYPPLELARFGLAIIVASACAFGAAFVVCAPADGSEQVIGLALVLVFAVALAGAWIHLPGAEGV